MKDFDYFRREASFNMRVVCIILFVFLAGAMVALIMKEYAGPLFQQIKDGFIDEFNSVLKGVVTKDIADGVAHADSNAIIDEFLRQQNENMHAFNSP